MELYVYGSYREVTRVKELLQRDFPELKDAWLIFDLPLHSNQEFCRIYLRTDREA